MLQIAPNKIHHRNSGLPHQRQWKYCPKKFRKTQNRDGGINKITRLDIPAISIPPASIILCDMDGTLLNTDYANTKAYEKAVMAITGSKEKVSVKTRRLDRIQIKLQMPSLNQKQLSLITELKTAYFDHFVATTSVNQQLVDLIINHQGVNKVTLVTRCRRARAVKLLKYHNLLRYFSHLICYEDLPNGNHSNKYHVATDMCKHEKNATFVFEDKMQEALNAQNIGISTSNIYYIQ